MNQRRTTCPRVRFRQNRLPTEPLEEAAPPGNRRRLANLCVRFPQHYPSPDLTGAVAQSVHLRRTASLPVDLHSNFPYPRQMEEGPAVLSWSGRWSYITDGNFER